MAVQDIKKDYAWNTVGVLIQNALSPLLLILITRINGISDSGLFSYAFSLAVIFWAISMWGGRTFQVSDINKEFSYKSYVYVRVLLTMGIVLAAYIFCISNSYGNEKTIVIVMLALLKGIESVADALYGILQVHNKLYVAGKSLLYKSIGGLVAFFVIDLITSSLVLSCLSLIVVNVALLLAYDFPSAARHAELQNVRGRVKEVLNEGLAILQRTSPVFGVLFLAMFSLNIPRYFIDKFHQGDIGYFGIIAMPITLIGLVMGFILQPNVVNLSNMYANQDYSRFKTVVSKIVLRLMVSGIIVFAITFLVGTDILHIVFNIDFSSYRTALIVIVAGGICNALVAVFMNTLIITRHFKGLFYTLLLTNLGLLLSCSIIMVHSGLLAAVVLFALTNVVQLIALKLIYEITVHNDSLRQRRSA